MSPSGAQIPVKLDALYFVSLEFTDADETGLKSSLTLDSASAHVSEVVAGCESDLVLRHLSI